MDFFKFGPEEPTGILLKKRSRHSSDSGTEEQDNDVVMTWTKHVNKRCRKPSIIVKSKEMQRFFQLLYDRIIYDFLCMDSCKKISDKYLIAMVFAYFKRAHYSLEEFTRINFFVALYLANDMEEDEEDYKYEMFPWALGKSWQDNYIGFLALRDKLWARINYRAVVSSKCCEEVMAIDPSHWVWQRERPEHHAGALRQYMRGPDEDAYPRGPDGSPRYCDKCEEMVQYDSASPDADTWYLSSCSDSSPEAVMPCKALRVVAPSNFDMQGLKQTLQEEDDIWAHDE